MGKRFLLTEDLADPLTQKVLSITVPSFPEQLSACPCILSTFSHPNSLYTVSLCH